MLHVCMYFRKYMYVSLCHCGCLCLCVSVCACLSVGVYVYACVSARTPTHLIRIWFLTHNHPSLINIINSILFTLLLPNLKEYGADFQWSVLYILQKEYSIIGWYGMIYGHHSSLAICHTWIYEMHKLKRYYDVHKGHFKHEYEKGKRVR